MGHTGGCMIIPGIAPPPPIATFCQWYWFCAITRLTSAPADAGRADATATVPATTEQNVRRSNNLCILLSSCFPASFIGLVLLQSVRYLPSELFTQCAFQYLSHIPMFADTRMPIGSKTVLTGLHGKIEKINFVITFLVALMDYGLNIFPAF